MPPIAVAVDGTGLIDFSLPLGRYRVSDPQHSLSFRVESTKKLPGLALVPRSHPVHSASVAIAADDSTLWLEVDFSESLRVQAVDERGEAVRPFRIWQEVQVPTPGGQLGEKMWVPVEANGGILARAGPVSLARFQPLRLGSEGYRIGVGARGFQAQYLSSALEDTEPRVIEVVLSLHESPRHIVALKTDGSPYMKRVLIQCETQESVIFDGLPEGSSGLVGPFLFDGDEVLVVNRFSQGARVRIADLDVADFAEGAIPTVRIDVSCSLEVQVPQGIIDGLRIQNSSRQTFFPDFRSERLVFEGIPAGEFVLLSPGLERGFSRLRANAILGFSAQGVEELFPIKLQPGEHRVMALPPEFASSTIEGRILLPGDMKERVFVYPLGAGGTVPRIVLPGDSRETLDSNGRYRITDWAPPPARLAVVRIDEQGWYIPLGTLRPGDDHELRCGELMIRAAGMSWYCAQTSFTVGGVERFGVACAEGTEALSLGWFPEGNVSVRLVAPDERYTVISAVVSAGVETRLDVEASPAVRSSEWSAGRFPKAFTR